MLSGGWNQRDQINFLSIQGIVIVVSMVDAFEISSGKDGHLDTNKINYFNYFAQYLNQQLYLINW